MKQHHCTLTLLFFQGDTRQRWERRGSRTRLKSRHHFKSVHRDSQRHPVHHPDVPQVTSSDLWTDCTRLKHTVVKPTVSNVFSSWTRAHCFPHLEELKPAGRSQQGGVQRDNTIPGHLPLRGRHLPVELERPHHHIGHWRNDHQVKTSCTRWLSNPNVVS